MACTCNRPEAAGGPHHHRFGGTYPCSAPQPCLGCPAPVPEVRFEEPPWPAVDDLPMDI